MVSEKPWKPDAVVRLLACVLVTVFSGACLGSVIHHLMPDLIKSDLEFLGLILSAMSFQGGILLWVALFVREHNTTWREAFGFSHARLGRAAAFGVLSMVIAIPVTMFMGEVIAKIIYALTAREAELQPIVVQMQSAPGMTWERKTIYGVVAVLLAPIAEEVLFRGILYPAVKQSGYPRVALWGTSVLFAVMHVLSGTFLPFLPLVFLAVVLTGLYEMTDTLLAPILAHGLFNAFNFWQLLHQQKL